MSNFLLELFKDETIYSEPKEDLREILSLVSDEYLDILSFAHGLDTEKNREEILDDLHSSILLNFKKTLLKSNKDELKSFNEFYNGIIDYSDKYVYLNLKKFSNLGFVYIFISKTGTYFHFVIPKELLTEFEDLLKNSWGKLWKIIKI